ncbi:hypothetical protein BH23GEM2_BH23GEM2_24330 [soil metagenome]
MWHSTIGRICVAVLTGIVLGPSTVEVFAQGDGTADLTAVRNRAVETRTDAIRIWRDGKALLIYDAPDRPDQLTPQSIVKPIVALAVLKLLEDGKLDSLDQPIYTLYPEWRQGRKKAITIRHVLTHTTGLQNEPNVQAELAQLPDRVQAALAAEVQEDPGTRWRYNNKAYWLLGGIIERASGERAEDYIRRNVFEPLGITDARWTYDPSGRNLAVTGGLYLRPDEIARLGQLVLDEGSFNGRQVIRADLVREAISPLVTIGAGSSSMGLGWMLGRRTLQATFGDSALSILRSAQLPAEFISRVERLHGTYSDWASFDDSVEVVFGNRNAFNDAVASVPAVWNAFVIQREDKPSFIFHTGDGGQYLYIVPASRLVAVRLIRDLFSLEVLDSPEFSGKDRSDPEILRELGRRYMSLSRATGFGDFGPRVLRLQ